jgi:uncharacterized membrane protein YhhN
MQLLSIHYFPVLLVLLALVFVIREIGTFKGSIRVKYALTPLITSLIIGFVVLSMSVSGTSRYRVLVMAALVLSLAADTMLMIVEADLFYYGLAYFLFAHIAYAAAFSFGYAFKPWHVIPAVILSVFVVMINMRIKGKKAVFHIAVVIYSIAVSVVLFFAVASFDYTAPRRFAFACAGAVLFFISDLTLAFFTFIRPYKHESVIAWALYAPGQLFIALSCFA